MLALGVAPAVGSMRTRTTRTGVDLKADFVFIIDATGSMADEIAAVKNGLTGFVNSLQNANIDPRFAVVLFGGAPELVLDFTSSLTDTTTAFNKISVNGAVAGFQQNHNVNPEAGLEAIRMVLNGSTEVLVHTFVGGDGRLTYRPDAVKNLILVTDEDSNLPFYVSNRQPGQTGTEPPSILTAPWQAEIDATAAVVIANNAFVNMIMNPGDPPSASQYGNPASSVSDPDFLNFDAQATLAKHIADGFPNYLAAQVLAAGLIGRAFNITQINTPNFINNFFAAKVQEVQQANLPPVWTGGPGTTCGTAPPLVVQAGVPTVLSLNASAPEAAQTTTVTYTAPPFVSVQTTPNGSDTKVDIVILAGGGNLGGPYVIKLVATDNGTPVLTTETQICFSVEGALAVDLSSFHARCNSQGAVWLQWETAAEIDHAGFNLYRTARGHAGMTKVNPSLIQAQGAPRQGASYEYLDGGAVKGFVHHYWLESVDSFGATKLYGPVSLSVPQ